MQNVAQSWLVYRLTGSSVLLGMVGFAGQIPVFLISPLGGLIADRHSRHRTVMATQISAMLLAFILAALTLTGRIEVWHIFVLAALLGVVNAFDMPARQAFLVEMVGREDLINAIALNSSMFNGARIVGPAVAGILVAAIGEGWCFFANAVSYIAVIAGLAMMKVVPAAPLQKASAIGHIAEGFRFVAHAAPIRVLLLLLGLVSLTGMPYAVLMPVFADHIFHSGARGLGILMGFSGVGALIGALALATRQGVRGLGRWVAVSTGVFGASLILFSFSRQLWIGAALLIPVGLSMMIQMGASNTLIQTMTSRSSARTRHGGLLHDVHGHGAHRCAAVRCPGEPPRRAVHRGHWGRDRHCRQFRFRPAIAGAAPGSAAIDHGAAHGGRRPGRRSDRARRRRSGFSQPEH